MFYVRYLRNELVRRRTRTIVTIVGLGLGVALVVSIASLSKGLDRAQHKTLDPLAGIGTDLTVTLQPQQFSLLWCLMAHADRVLSPAFLLAQNAIASTTGPTTLHTAIGRLRRILRAHGLDHCLQTVHGFGYRFVPPQTPFAPSPDFESAARTGIPATAH